MTSISTHEAPLLPQTVYNPYAHSRAQHFAGSSSLDRTGSVRTERSLHRSVRPARHDAFRESYYPLDDSEPTQPSIRREPTNESRSIGSFTNYKLPPLSLRTQYPDVDGRPPSPPAASVASHGSLARPQPAQTKTDYSGHCHQEVCLDRGYFNNFIPASIVRMPGRPREASWHSTRSAEMAGTVDMEKMSTMLSTRNLKSAQSSLTLKGTSGFDKSVEDLALGQRAKKMDMMTILLLVVVVLLFLEECVVGTVWALYLCKQADGANAFARGYFESKATNFGGSAIGALIGLIIQWFLYPKLHQNRIALQLWSLIVVFLAYMGCCIAAGMTRRLQY